MKNNQDIVSVIKVFSFFSRNVIKCPLQYKSPVDWRVREKCGNHFMGVGSHALRSIKEVYL